MAHQILDSGPLARRLDALAREPRLETVSPLLRRLARAVESGAGLSQWSSGGLAAAHAGPEALAPGSRRSSVWARRAGLASSVLVFLPLLLTWSGLGAAVLAYRAEQRDKSAHVTGTFLELWQQGFGGHLVAFLRFDFLVLYTVVLLAALVALTLWRQAVEERDQEDDRKLLRELAGALAETEARATAAAHTEPVTFVRQLQDSASELREMLKLAAVADERTATLLNRTVQATEQITGAGTALSAAATALADGTRRIAESAAQAATATRELEQQAERLGESVSSTAAALSRAAQEASTAAAQGLAEAAGRAADRFETVTAEATDRGSRQLELLQQQAQERAEEMDRLLTERLAEADLRAERQAEQAGRQLADARVALEGSSTKLADAAASLGRDLAALPDRLADAADSGAEHIGVVYENAVAALAASLYAEVQRSSGALTDRFHSLDTALARQESARERGFERELASEQRLLASAAESRAAVESLVRALERLASVPPPTDVAAPAPLRSPADARPTAGEPGTPASPSPNGKRATAATAHAVRPDPVPAPRPTPRPTPRPAPAPAPLPESAPAPQPDGAARPGEEAT
ncbi:hypothetical protein [Streptacidiphilus melanogenes]|uniref:hypothetical protein n=1 Tax=Streptacidiphilus melanogenes TaxID=411235 RepID=UPI00126A6247|nr:hypothetical protein [Streptacidiphilus melanogenes]